MKIIPAIDLIEGKCVRLEKGDYSKKKVYNEDPLEVALQFEAHGLQYLHLVDLDGAKAGRIINWKVLEKLAGHTSLHIDFGGGVKTDDDVRIAFECGARQINVGSTAVKDRPALLRWLELWGPERIILSADVRDGNIAIHGWQTPTDIALTDFIRSYHQQGISTVTCTDIARDGMLSGPSLELYQSIMEAIPDIQLIASGGVSSMHDLQQLEELQLYGAIIGKAIYEGKISLKELESRMVKRGS